MRKGVQESKINFDKIYGKLNYKEFEQVTVRTYKDDSISEGCLIEALIYPSNYAYESMEGTRGEGSSDVAVYLRIQDLVNKANFFSSKKSKVSRVILLDEKI